MDKKNTSRAVVCPESRRHVEVGKLLFCNAVQLPVINAEAQGSVVLLDQDDW